MLGVLEVKKLVLVSAASMSMTGARKKALEYIPYIYYSVQFKKNINKVQVQALINLGSEVNIIHLTFTKLLGLPIRPIDIGVQKIDNTTLNTYKMIVEAFLVVGNVNQIKFFEEIFLMANVSPEVVLEMLFLTLSNVDIDFSGRELRWRTYTTKEVFPTTKYIELVGKKEFAAATLDPKYKTYIIHVTSINSTLLIASLESIPLNVHLSQRIQISSLIAKEAHIKILDKYAKFADVFFSDLASKLSEHIGIIDHNIELANG